MRRQLAATAAVLSLVLVLSGLGTAQAAPAAAIASLPRSLVPESEAAAALAMVEPGLQVMESDKHGLVLELLTPSFEVEQAMADDGPCSLIAVVGYGEIDKVGGPRLPVRGAMVGIPPGAGLILTVLETETAATPDHYALCPVPQPVVEIEPTGEMRTGGVKAIRDAQAYAADRLYPASPAEVVSTGWIRSQQVAQLRFHPFQYNPASGELRHNRRIRVRLDFVASESPAQLSGAGIEEGSFEEILRLTLANYDTARQWRVRPEPAALSATPAMPGSPGYKILVDRDGIYQVTYDDLQAAGLDISGVDPHTLKVRNQGVEVAIEVAGEDDGSFDDGDSILFYGQKMNTKYTDTNVYWLTWGGSDGRRMMTRDGHPTGTGNVPQSFQHTTRVEHDLVYNSRVPWGGDQDHWFWEYVLAYGSPASKTYSVPTDGIATIPFSATVRGLLDGYSSFGGATPDHHTIISLNGHLIDDATWDGESEYPFEAQVPGSYLLDGSNLVSIACPNDLGFSYDAVYINWLEIDYQRTYTATGDPLRFAMNNLGRWEYRIGGFATGDVEVFDITDPAKVSRILDSTFVTGTCRFEDTVSSPTEYLVLATAQRLSPVQIIADVPSDLRATTNSADYVIITHADFYTDVLPLASYRASQGLRTKVVDVQDIYDEFNGGVFDPEAIKDFLAYAYAEWEPPAPGYVLLVGDGSLDFKDNLETGYRNFVPPYLAAVDPWINETATDNRYVCVSGGDVLPDMQIGRLPANTSAEAATMVGKILNYEQSLPSGGWNQRVLFVADKADQSGDYPSLSDAVADHYLPPAYTPQKIYSGVTHATPAEANAAIIDAINDGQLLVNYVGHASYQWWGMGMLLHVNDIPSLTNAEKLPVIVSMSCYDGFFHAPGIPSLGESIVRAPGGGAIASWSPTGLGLAMGHDFLDRGLFEALFFDGVTQLGPATTQAKLYLYNTAVGYQELIDTYLLFGDPALRLAVRLKVYLPIVLKQ